MDYYNILREELFPLIDDGPHNILEIGCGKGRTGYELKTRGKAAKVIGIELVESVACEARSYLDEVYCGDLESMTLPFADSEFDYILAADVLEHLRDPWLMVTRLRRYLKSDGFMVASIPNVQYYRVIKDLMFKGEWRYTDGGLLDISHLRFFTKKSIVQLFAGEFKSVMLYPKYGRHKEIINRLTGNLLQDFFVFQYLIKAGNRS